jgi:hypothetical protein
MNPTQSLPTWLQYAWAFGGVTVAVGGVFWVACIFYPYLKLTRRVMLESLELGKKTATLLDQIQTDLSPIITKMWALVRDAGELMQHRDRVEKIIAAIEELPKKLDELVHRAEKKGIDDIIDRI